MAYGHLKDLTTRTVSDKVLRDKAFNISKNPEYEGYQRGLASVPYTFFDKKSKGGGAANNNNNNNNNNINIKQNIHLTEDLHKPIIRNFFKKNYSGFKDNICYADLADMQLINTLNKGFRFLLCVIDIFSKYLWFFYLKDKKCVSIIDAF